MHVAVSTVDKLCDYVMHTAPDGLRSAASVQTIMSIIEANEQHKEVKKTEAFGHVL
jgi:4-O-beta-D-mannosyl-D-glucose phosphorylase